MVLEEIVGIVLVGCLVFGDSLVVSDEEGDDGAVIVPVVPLGTSSPVFREVSCFRSAVVVGCLVVVNGSGVANSTSSSGSSRMRNLMDFMARVWISYDFSRRLELVGNLQPKAKKLPQKLKRCPSPGPLSLMLIFALPLDKEGEEIHWLPFLT